MDSLQGLLIGESLATARERDTAQRAARIADDLHEAELDGLVAKFAAWRQQMEEALTDSRANGSGVVAQREALLKEIAKIDPNNWLLNKPNRDRIYLNAYDQRAAEERANRD
jgi:hypothetical protein